MNERKTRTLNVGLVGLPNAGKSTLINALLNRKVSIVSSKPQTTRSVLMADLRVGDTQIVISDTPGIFKAKGILERIIVKNAVVGLREVDALLWVVDVFASRIELYDQLLKVLKSHEKPIICLMNKIDAVHDPIKIAQLALEIQKAVRIESLLYVSALKGTGHKLLINKLASLARPGKFQQVQAIKDSVFACEITREHLFKELFHELPYSIAVVTETWEKLPNAIRIYQVIYVASQKHKAMLIGKGGAMLKAIGTSARLELSKHFGVNVSLFLNVLVKDDWQNKTYANEMIQHCTLES